jgi:hypothetical protein
MDGLPAPEPTKVLKGEALSMVMLPDTMFVFIAF